MPLFFFVFLLYYLFEPIETYDSCLHYRSICLRNDTCQQHLQHFQSSCGYDLNVCSGTSPSDCVFHLQRIRDTFPTKTCTCYEAIGFSEECDFFRQFVWNHPCERKMRDVGEEMKLNNRKLLQIESNRYAHENGQKRTTRTPAADQVQQWKSQLSGELTKETIQQKTCDAALYQVCLKHVSCAQLWGMFRKNCDVDQDNLCRMADRNVCWQSFEGLTWSGLGDCHCSRSNSSDCHWIRLHTNYNKCIYEISKSGQFPILMSLAQKNREENQQRTAEEYRKRYENRETVEVSQPQPQPTGPPRVPSTTTTTTSTTTTTREPTGPPATTVPAWWQSDQMPRHRDTSRRDEYSVQMVRNEKSNSNSFKLKAVIDPPTQISDPGPQKESAPKFQPRKSSARSSCPDAIRRCESVDECRWHLGELRVRCSTAASCRREECAASLQRFSTYVPFALVESIMFCHCAPEDEACLTQQEMIYPKCLYKSSGFMQTCTQAVQKCDSDTRCRHIRQALTAHCPVRNGECARNSLDDCRRTILSARASILEQPCFCKLSDVQCLAHQNSMIPTNPCIESAMIEYSRIMGYNKPGLTTNRVVEEEEPMRRAPSTIIYEPTVQTTMAAIYQEPPKPSPRSAVPTNNSSRPGKRMRTSTTRAPRTTLAPPTTTRAPTPTQTSKKSSFLDLFGIFGKKETKNDKNEEGAVDKMEVAPVTEPQDLMIKKSPDGLGSNGKKPKFRTTVSPPAVSEAPPPWVSTTSTVATSTTVFTTHAPPPQEGCSTKDANGREIFTHIGAIMRKYVDWSGRCSTWCECESEDHLSCEPVPCLEHGTCDAPLTTIEFGERVFLKDRGACYCETGNFVCEYPSDPPETYPGLYISVGYSLKDVELIRKAVPREILDKAGFSSSDASNDIASRMQIAFERLLPQALQCRIVTMHELSEPGNALYKIEWYGRNELLNHTRTQWHSDGAEKICSPYVRKLADHFALNESPRFQLVLSTVKQVKVLDYLDGLPMSFAVTGLNCQSIALFLITLILITFR
ncbi:unnamed protein product [Caenorhabditis sp. 36 PRJEB53466]|nr:unnamed protein product [Caenorhabditis sp. 36 PRJEB53466]